MVTASLPLAFAFLTQLSEHVRPGPCVIAKRPAPTVEAAALPAPLKHRIQEYRAKWRALCVGAPDRPDLETLLGEAIAIADELNEEKPPAAVLETLIAYEEGELPGLGPGLDVMMYVYSNEFVAMLKSRGTASDWYFWNRYPAVDTIMGKPPWMRGAWDYGGCIRYGEYDWIAGLNTLKELKANELGLTYRTLIRDADHGMWGELEEFSTEYPHCACGETLAVVRDLRRVLAFVSRTPALESHAVPLKTRIHALKTGEAKLQSYAQNYCGH